MTEYALLKDGVFAETRQYEKKPDDIAHKKVRWVAVSEDNPSHDPATQIKSGPAIAVEADRVVRRWTVRNKTAQELDSEKDGKITAIDLLQFEVMFDMENRVRALESKPAITKVQYRNALKARL